MTVAGSRIAVVTGIDSAAAQALFAKTIAQWRRAGITVAAVLAETLTPTESICSADVLRDIGSGVAYSIHLDAPPRDTSCHLDARGVDAACAALLPQLETCDLVVLSKFGKLEAMGGGLFPAFAAARAAGLPVLTTVSAKHEEAWRAFAPDAVTLPANAAALQDWWRALGHPHAMPRDGVAATPGRPSINAVR
jgi:hypothetical protein